MYNLFKPEDNQEIITRINKLTHDTKPLWGKMTVSQMLAHVQHPLKSALGDQTYKKTLMSFLFGKIAKKQMVIDKPFKKNLPTDPGFIVKDDRNFTEEKNKLVDLIQRFGKEDPEKISKRPHSFFGKLTADEWNTLQSKHLDHHLKQFGV